MNTYLQQVTPFVSHCMWEPITVNRLDFMICVFIEKEDIFGQLDEFDRVIHAWMKIYLKLHTITIKENII